MRLSSSAASLPQEMQGSGLLSECSCCLKTGLSCCSRQCDHHSASVRWPSLSPFRYAVAPKDVPKIANVELAPPEETPAELFLLHSRDDLSVSAGCRPEQGLLLDSSWHAADAGKGVLATDSDPLVEIKRMSTGGLERLSISGSGANTSGCVTNWCSRAFTTRSTWSTGTSLWF